MLEQRRRQWSNIEQTLVQTGEAVALQTILNGSKTVLTDKIPKCESLNAIVVFNLFISR